MTDEEFSALVEKLHDESLDAICEVVGSPRLYNEGKSAMREWFMNRLRYHMNIRKALSPVEAAGMSAVEIGAEIDRRGGNDLPDTLKWYGPENDYD